MHKYMSNAHIIFFIFLSCIFIAPILTFEFRVCHFEMLSNNEHC